MLNIDFSIKMKSEVRNCGQSDCNGGSAAGWSSWQMATLLHIRGVSTKTEARQGFGCD